MSELAEATRLCHAKQELGAPIIWQIAEDLLNPANSEADKLEFLRALTDKGETARELLAFTNAFLPKALDPGINGTWHGKPLLDCCGTGGGGLNVVNISTTMMFVLAAGGVPVVKHGNIGVTKISGSSDVLGVLGIPTTLTPGQNKTVFEASNLGFFHAPFYHPTFKLIAPLRRKLAEEGRRTVFNLLGPLINPARPDAQMIGLFKKAYVPLFGEVLELLGRKHHLAIYSEAEDGTPIGEYSILGPNTIHTSLDFDIPDRTRDDLGSYKSLLISGPGESARRILDLFKGGEQGLFKEIIIANSALGFVVTETSDTWDEGLDLAREIIESGRALQKLEQWRQFCTSV
ncbi:MAG: anthranilate phosphoribosyltransferase [Verrucomicrobiales bacterium]|jgi:anthranilate phosphoribosyltransferase|nr:anthranilate phosphoribosyltransferase [Verrucomicrobiales bacterium]